MFTNVDNLEEFIKMRGRTANATYLKGYALKTSPATILRDLRSMGVYAGSLFPGLDGVCRGVFEDEIEND